MSRPKNAAFRGIGPKASLSPLLVTHVHDEPTLSVSSSTTMIDPQTQLLHRWKRISEQISRARLSCDAVITLNRSLDLAEETILHRAAMDENSERIETAEGSEMLKPISSDEVILDRVTKAVSLLRSRQQSLKRLHETMVMRIEKQAKNIEQLHLRANCLERDIVDDESELTYLKLQLRIIEVQTLPYWPRKDQDELAAGIERWKRDWADVNERYRKRRWKRQVDNARHVGTDPSAEIRPVNSSTAKSQKKYRIPELPDT